MNYYTNLFSPETYEAFSRSNRDVSGFRVRQRKAASRVRVGDRLICYMTKLSRWTGVLEVISTSYEDGSPIFYPEDDPFVVRFKVQPIAWLEKEKAIPIKDDRVWEHLSFTRGLDKKSPTWTGQIRGSLNHMNAEDAQFLENLILSQVEDGEEFPIDKREYEKLVTHTVRRVDKVVTVTVPQETDPEDEEDVPPARPEVRESIVIQATLAEVGRVRLRYNCGMGAFISRRDPSQKTPGACRGLISCGLAALCLRPAGPRALGFLVRSEWGDQGLPKIGQPVAVFFSLRAPDKIGQSVHLAPSLGIFHMLF